MFDWLKKVFGGGSKTSNTPTRSNQSRNDDAERRRRREEEERRRREAESRRRAEQAAAQRQRQIEANRQMGLQREQEAVERRKVERPDNRNDKQKELDALTVKNLDQARKEEKQRRTGIFDDIADVIAGGAREKRAQATARQRAADQYQEKHGWNADKEVVDYTNRTLRKAKENSASAQKATQVTKNVVEAARYLPGAGLGELGANVIRGNFAGTQEADDRLLREQMELSPAQIRSLSAEDRKKYLLVAKGGLAAGVLDLAGVGVGTLAKGAVKGGIRNTTASLAKSSARQVAKDMATKQGAKMLMKNAAVGAVAGGAIGAGGAKALGADNEAALQAGTRGALGGAFGGAASSPLDMAAASLRKGAPVKRGIRGALKKTDGLNVTDAALKTAQRQVSRDVASIPGAAPATPASPNKIEVAPGVSVEQAPEKAPRGNLNPEPQPVQGSSGTVDNTPAFQRRNPDTVGSAQAQYDMTGRETPMDADASLEVNQFGDDIDIPAFMRRNADERAANAQSQLAAIDERIAGIEGTTGRAATFEDRIAIANAYKESPEKGRATEAFIRARADRADTEAALKDAIMERTRIANELEAARAAQGANARLENPAVEPAPVNIPDPVTNPIALAKGDDAMFPDFGNAITAPLQKADTVPEPQPVPVAEPTPTDISDAAAQGDLRVPTRGAEPTAEGNAPLRSDAQVQQEAAEAGIVPNRGDSPLAIADEAEQAARAKQAQEQVAGQTDAPLTRERAVERITDDEIREDMMQNAPAKNTVNLEEAENSAKAYLNRMDDIEVQTRFSDGVRVDDPTSFYTALNAVRRLERINTPEAQAGIRNAVDAMAEYAAESGRGLRTVQVLFDDMPATMKVDYLTRRLSKAGAELTDDARAKLATEIQAADNATANLRALEDRARKLLEDGSITNGNITPELQAQARQLSEAIQKAELEKEAVSGRAFREYQQHLDGQMPMGKKAGDVGRTLMLSAPSGRIFDVISTTLTTGDDLLTRGVSNLVGKAVNAATGSGRVESTLPNARELAKGAREGAVRIGRSFRGDDFVEDFLGEAKRSTRGDISSGGGPIRRTVRTLVEAPTNLTRGLRKDQLYREGMQEAQKQGLKGDAAKTYAQLRATVPTAKQLDKATDAQMRANMLHENGVSRMLNGFARTLDNNKVAGGWLAPLIRNQVAPFTSWLGGNLNRTFTDKNVLYNASHAIVEARRGNVQGVIDDISKLGVNSAQAYVMGALLTQAGLITTEDANGDDYGGLYFHIGDRYIPVAIAGTMAVPIILGNAFEQAAQAAKKGEPWHESFANALAGNIYKNAGMASVFGGENNLQSSISKIGEGDVTGTAAKFVGDVVRQYMPAISGDINAFLNLNSQLNPTGEAAETKVLTADPDDNANKQDVLQTEVAKTLNRLPFMSQGLERKEGQLAQDPLDRILKGNREGDARKAEKAEEAAAQSLEDTEKQLKKDGIPVSADGIEAAAKKGKFDEAIRGAEHRLAKLEASKDAEESKKEALRTDIKELGLRKEGVPLTDESIKARMEEGAYDKVIRGLEYEASKIENDPDVPQSKKDEIATKIGRTRIYQEGEYEPDIVRGYESTKSAEGGVGVTAWREMMNSGDPELVAAAERLAELDAKMVEAGHADKAKYYWGKGGRGGGGRGGRGGRGGSGGAGRGGKAITTDIATNDQNFSLKPLKKAEESSTPKIAIPEVELVKNYDTSKLKKIKVSKGA